MDMGEETTKIFGIFVTDGGKTKLRNELIMFKIEIICL